jgi:hypothetical protein
MQYNWLERVKLPENQNEGGRFTHSTFVEMGTNKPLLFTGKDQIVKTDTYYFDYDDKKLLGHYGVNHGWTFERLKQEYIRVKNMSPEEAMKDSPLKVESFS